MMGLEPTTFCMANGSWVRPGGAAIALFMRRSANTMRVVDVAQMRHVSRRFATIWALTSSQCPI